MHCHFKDLLSQLKLRASTSTSTLLCLLLSILLQKCVKSKLYKFYSFLLVVFFIFFLNFIAFLTAWQIFYFSYPLNIVDSLSYTLRHHSTVNNIHCSKDNTYCNPSCVSFVLLDIFLEQCWYFVEIFLNTLLEILLLIFLQNSKQFFEKLSLHIWSFFIVIIMQYNLMQLEKTFVFRSVLEFCAWHR